MTLRQSMLCSISAAMLAAAPAWAQTHTQHPAPVTPGADIPGAQGMHPQALPAPSLPQAPVMAPSYPGGPVPPASPYPMAAYPVAAPYPGGPVSYAQPGMPMAVPAHGAPAAWPPEYQQARADWVAECASRYRADRRGGGGGLIGGLLGAVVGGVVGNRVDDRGSRLGGTLIGAGVGGLAGAVVGSAIDRGNRRKHDDEALDWCEDYLARNTSQGGPAYGGYGYGAPMMMVPVMVPVRRCHRHEIVERVVEKPVYRTIPAPRKPVPVKATKLQPAAPSKLIKAQ